MKDYQAIWIKWEALLQSDLKARKELLDSLNIEVKKGFDVIVRITSEELASQTEKKLNEFSEDIQKYMAVLAYGGYILFLVQSNTDPIKENLVERSSTSELGNIWMESFEKDKGISYIEKIDPILSLILDSEKQTCLSSLLSEYSKIGELSYKEIHMVELYFLWVAQQGYIFGMIEKELASK